MTTKDVSMDKTEMEEYQEFVAKCKQPDGAKQWDPKLMKAWWVAGHGFGEMAEVFEVFEKAYRKDTPVDIDKVIDEVGDTLWCLACIANTMDFTLDDAIMHNIDKLTKREAKETTTNDR